MCEPTNATRAQWAAQVAYCFGSNPQCRGHLNATPADIDDGDIGDLLVDLMHLCRAIGLDFDERVDTARMHFIADIAEEPAVERTITLQDVEEITYIRATDKGGEAWQKYDQSTELEPCGICGEDISDGWRSRESGMPVCNRHVALPGMAASRE